MELLKCPACFRVLENCEHRIKEIARGIYELPVSDYRDILPADQTSFQTDHDPVSIVRRLAESARLQFRKDCLHTFINSNIKRKGLKILDVGAAVTTRGKVERAYRDSIKGNELIILDPSLGQFLGYDLDPMIKMVIGGFVEWDLFHWYSFDLVICASTLDHLFKLLAGIVNTSILH